MAPFFKVKRGHGRYKRDRNRNDMSSNREGGGINQRKYCKMKTVASTLPPLRYQMFISTRLSYYSITEKTFQTKMEIYIHINL